MATPAPPQARRLPLFVGALLVGALSIALLSPREQVGAHPGLLAALVVFAVAVDLMRIDIFDRSNVSPASVPILALARPRAPTGAASPGRASRGREPPATSPPAGRASAGAAPAPPRRPAPARPSTPSRISWSRISWSRISWSRISWSRISWSSSLAK